MNSLAVIPSYFLEVCATPGKLQKVLNKTLILEEYISANGLQTSLFP